MQLLGIRSIVLILYRFFKEWFDWSKYDSKRVVLNEAVVTTMDAVRNNEFLLATEPSEDDMELLVELYGS
jgi:hypothetical protein